MHCRYLPCLVTRRTERDSHDHRTFTDVDRCFDVCLTRNGPLIKAGRYQWIPGNGNNLCFCTVANSSCMAHSRLWLHRAGALLTAQAKASVIQGTVEVSYNAEEPAVFQQLWLNLPSSPQAWRFRLLRILWCLSTTVLCSHVHSIPVSFHGLLCKSHVCTCDFWERYISDVHRRSFGYSSC